MWITSIDNHEFRLKCLKYKGMSLCCFPQEYVDNIVYNLAINGG